MSDVAGKCYDYAMIGIAIILSFIAMIIALARNGKHKWLVMLLFGAVIITLLITNKLANPDCPPAQTCNSFEGIGPAIFGSLVSFMISISALILSFRKEK